MKAVISLVLDASSTSCKKEGLNLFFLILKNRLFGRPLILAGDASKTLDLNRDFDDLEIIYLIKKEIVNPDSKINKEGLNLILQMLKSNPRTRITAAEALEHPYFKTSTTRALLRAASKDSNTGDLK